LHFKPSLKSLRSHSQTGTQVFIIAKAVTTRNALQIDQYSQTTGKDSYGKTRNRWETLIAPFEQM